MEHIATCLEHRWQRLTLPVLLRCFLITSQLHLGRTSGTRLSTQVTSPLLQGRLDVDVSMATGQSLRLQLEQSQGLVMVRQVQFRLHHHRLCQLLLYPLLQAAGYLRLPAVRSRPRGAPRCGRATPGVRQTISRGSSAMCASMTGRWPLMPGVEAPTP